MKQTKLNLVTSDRAALEAFRSKGVHRAREVNRAHMLLALDCGISEPVICSVLGVGRTAVWRTRSAYGKGGLEFALHDEPRSGQPRKYQTSQEAEVMALASSAPPGGRKRWTISLLTTASRERPGLAGVNRETVRKIFKKTTANPGVR